MTHSPHWLFYLVAVVFLTDTFRNTVQEDHLTNIFFDLKISGSGINKWAQILLLVWQLSLPTCGVLAFVCPASTRGISTATITSTLGLSPLDGGTSGESNEKAEKKRMEMVRKLQKTFYKPTDGASGDEEPQPRLDEESGIVTDLPLWRVGWIDARPIELS